MLCIGGLKDLIVISIIIISDRLERERMEKKKCEKNDKVPILLMLTVLSAVITMSFRNRRRS